MSSVRRILGLLHRWFGLFTAVFLFISGITGAFISFDHELDALINPSFSTARSGPAALPMPSVVLADRIESADPRVRVTYLPLSTEPGHALQVFVGSRIDTTTGQPYTLPFNQLALDPATGELQDSREWGAVSLSPKNVLSFLYKLHYTMHIPDAFGFPLGGVFMGIVAIVWTLDCFVSLVISFPSRKLWRRSFVFSWREGGRRLLFDIHRSGGVWVWSLLLVLAVTAISMNLGHEVMRPIVSVFSTLTPDPFDTRKPNPPEDPIEPRLDRVEAIRIASAEAAVRGWDAPPGGIFYSPDFGLYGVGFFTAENDHGDGSLGNPWLYVDGRDGTLAGADVPGEGSAGDLFLQAQFPVHSGRLFGLPGRILISAMGLAVAALSATGVYFWARRRFVRARTVPAAEELALEAQP
jgi:uncharacterized iron-regulated membrane protein